MLLVVLGVLFVYSFLFATGYWLYENYLPAILLTLTAAISGIILLRRWVRTYSVKSGNSFTSH